MRTCQCLLWLASTIAIFAVLLEVAQAAPVLQANNDKDLEINLQRRGGFGKKFKKAANFLTGGRRLERGESSILQEYTGGASPARSSSSGEPSETPSSRSSVSKGSSAEETDNETILEHATGRLPHNMYDDQMDQSPPHNIEQHFNGMSLADYYQDHSMLQPGGYHYGSPEHAPEPSPSVSSRRTSPAASLRSSPASSHRTSPAASLNSSPASSRRTSPAQSPRYSTDSDHYYD